MPISPGGQLKPLAFLRALVRWNEWYDSKIAFLLVCMYYAALSRPEPAGRLIAEMAILLAALCTYAAFGHIVNDFSDRAADRVAGKRNVLASLSEQKARIWVIVAGAVGIASALPYWNRPGVLASWIFAYALAAFYSLPPIRLKERGLAGLVAATLAQRTVPCLIVFSALNFWDWTAVALGVLSTLNGLRYIIVHQILDAHNDARAGIRTSGTEHGADRLSAMLTRFLFPLELASLIGAILLMGLNLPAVWAMGALYGALLLVRARRPIERMSPISYSLLADLYFLYWPLLLAALLALSDPAFIGVLVFTVAWLFRNFSARIVNAAGFFAAALRRKSDASSDQIAPSETDDGIFEQAVIHHDSGELQKAQELYQTVLQRSPNHFGAACRLGIIQLQRGRFEDADRLLRRAVHLDEKSADAQHALACALTGLGRAGEAAEHYQIAVALRPDFAEAHNNLGYALQVLGRHDEMITHYQQALAIRPQYAEARNNLGNGLHVLGRFEEALAQYNAAIVIRPDYAEAYWNKGNALFMLGRIEQAITQYQTALAHRPNFPEAHNSLGSALHVLGQHQQAAAEYAKALANRPDYLDARVNLGNLLVSMLRLEHAIEQYNRALSINPNSIQALNGRGAAQLRLKAYDLAWDSFKAAVQVDPDNAPAVSGLARAAAAGGDWQRTAQVSRDLLPRVAKGEVVIDPFTLLLYCGDPAVQLICAKTFIRSQLPAMPQPLWTNDVWRNDKIRIAYVASGLHRHPNAFLSVELFESHDRSRFEIIGISTGPDEASEMRTRIVKAFDSFHDVRAKSDRDIAELVHSMRVDVLVDRSGYTTNARPAIFAHRPAPIQINYLGYPGTLGADFYDYILADATVLPFDQQEFYSEKIVHLPDCYQSNDLKRVIAPSSISRDQAGLPQDGFVFCCFNNTAKITAKMFDVWMRLLRHVPQSVLWLLDEGPVAAENIRREAMSRGVESERIVFAPWVELADHLARHRLADLFLDTLPFNAHTTASDALWAGLPAITCYGESFAGRVAASLLKAVELAELVTANLDDYEALALRLATEPQLLRSFRDRLERNRLVEPLFDTRRYRTHIEAAYQEMWEIWQSGERPRSFAVGRIDAGGLGKLRLP